MNQAFYKYCLIFTLIFGGLSIVYLGLRSWGAMYLSLGLMMGIVFAMFISHVVNSK